MRREEILKTEGHVLINGKIPAIPGVVTKCKACSEEIRFGQAETMNWIPFNLDENNTAHWATCPKAKQFRKKKK